VVNHYGPTESAVVSTCGDVGTESPPPIGRPIANLRAYVLDRRQQPVPVGVPGELHVAGPSLARGYLGQPKMTADRFVPDPFSAQPGELMYRTGDLVRYRADAALDFLGRLDDQVQIRGHRIELSEIESVLTEQEMVAEAVVVVNELDKGRAELVAYIRPELSAIGGEGAHNANRPPQAELEEELGRRLRADLEQLLPSYMVPSVIVPLDKMPLTAHGKIDRRALPRPTRSGRPGGTPPQTAMEIRLAQVWNEILGVDQISRDDNFFDLGGHSLLTLQVVKQMEDQTGVRVPLGDVMMQSLGQIAAFFDREAAKLLQESPEGKSPRRGGVASFLRRALNLKRE
jgi:arthrofactin-type cyclic lipopeptide synthetase C